MAKQTFSWKPDLGARLSMKPNVTVITYGSDYEQRIPNGINSKRRVWTVEFSYPYTVHAQQTAFLEDAGGAKSFLWTDPRGVTSAYVCEEWESVQIEPGVYKLSATFKESFD